MLRQFAEPVYAPRANGTPRLPAQEEDETILDKFVHLLCGAVMLRSTCRGLKLRTRCAQQSIECALECHGQEAQCLSLPLRNTDTT